MSSATGAKNAWSDGIAFTSSQFGQTAQQCSNNTAVLSCEYIDYTYTNSGTQYSERYVAVQAGACYAEMTGTTTTSNISAASSTLVQILNQMAPAAVNAMNATCNPNTPPPPTAVPTATPRPTVPPAQTQFNVVAVRFEKNKKCDFSLKNNPVTQAKTGTKLYLRMYVNVASLGASSVGMTREYQLKLNGKKVFDQTFSDSITQNDTYCFYYPKTGYKVTKPGTYTFTAGAAMGGKVDAARAKLTVLQKYVAPKPVSFSLTNVSLASSTIHAGQQARVNVGFNVRNLKGTTNATITRTVLANLNGQWKGVSTNSSTTLVKNGQNSQSVTTQLNAPGHFEIQIAVTIGASTQRKTVGVTVA
jgi:hypothetical protein